MSRSGYRRLKFGITKYLYNIFTISTRRSVITDSLHSCSTTDIQQTTLNQYTLIAFSNTLKKEPIEKKKCQTKGPYPAMMIKTFNTPVASPHHCHSHHSANPTILNGEGCRSSPSDGCEFIIITVSFPCFGLCRVCEAIAVVLCFSPLNPGGVAKHLK